MGHYRARDLVNVPSLLSLSRLPLGLVFAAQLSRPWLSLTVLALAGVTDLLDGWYARRFGQATATGAVLDGVTDKLFTGIVAVSLVHHGMFSLPEALTLAAREIIELPLLVWWMVHRKRRREKAEDPKANRVGKLATVLQFAAICAALFHSPLRLVALYASALLGVVAALVYWRREIAAVR